jgi:DNA-binding NtrC family response regulator
MTAYEARDSEAAQQLLSSYSATDQPLNRLIRAFPKPRPPILQAMLYMEECIQGRRLAKHAIDAARLVSTQGADTELLLLLLAAWAQVSCRIGRPSEAAALVERARPLLSGAVRPEVLACFRFAEAVLERTNGNRSGCEQRMHALLETLDRTSPRHKFYEWEFALFLAQQARSTDVQPLLPHLSLATTDVFDKSRVTLVRFVNAVEICDLETATSLVGELTGRRPAPSMLCRLPFSGYQALLRLLQHTEELPSPGKIMPNPPPWVRVAACLLNREPDNALDLAREEAGRVLGAIFGTGFDSFSLVRAELATGRREGAIRLLNIRETRGNSNYLDAIFFARAEHLAGNLALAANHFANALTAVSQHGAQRRLDVELRMACELSREEIVGLTRAAEKRIHRARYIATPQSRRSAPAHRHSSTGTDAIIAHSAAMNRIKAAISRFADLDAPVLITGETGVGKEIVARALHQGSKRSDGPFTAVNCAAINESLLESELFGHERGAFTGADKKNKGLFLETGEGTILLDEIGDISPRLQSSLLRVLETGEIRPVGSARPLATTCRIIAATNADLEHLSLEGRFRRDLMFRLQRLGIYIPPLRERQDDIIPLVRHFLDLDRPPGEHAILSMPLIQTLRDYDWPGNVRELKNVIERMRLMHSDKLSYGIEDLDLKFHAYQRQDTNTARNAVPVKNGKPRAPRPPGIGDAYIPTDINEMLTNGKAPHRRLARLRSLFTTYGDLTRAEVIQLLNISPNTATKYLKQLCDEAFIERVEPSPSTRSHFFRRNGPTTRD